MSSGGSLAYFVELFKALSCFLQGALHGSSSQRPSSGRLHPTSNQALLPGTLALLFPISLRIFLGQGLVCPSTGTPVNLPPLHPLRPGAVCGLRPRRPFGLTCLVSHAHWEKCKPFLMQDHSAEAETSVCLQRMKTCFLGEREEWCSALKKKTLENICIQLQQRSQIPSGPA